MKSAWLYPTILLGLILFFITGQSQVIPENPLPIPLRVPDSVPGSPAYVKSQVFYDTIYQKFSRQKITRLLYGLAFIEPRHDEFGDTLQVIQSTQPFEAYRGKAIRKIDIKILAPFGSSVYDTFRTTVTQVGKTLNNLHMNTRKFVIRRNLLFHEGDEVDPSVLSDNERILRDMSAIDDARILVINTLSGSDSVDIIVVAKDVWSIGIDIPVITTSKIRFRIFDGNFLGLGDKLTTSMSLALNRAPFFLFEGGNYTYSNIAGSFIDVSIVYNTNDEGEQTMGASFAKGFITNRTKWAGGVSAFYHLDRTKVNEFASIANYYQLEGVWLGRSFLLARQIQSTRAVFSAGFYNKYYGSRPAVTIDSNRGYYNVWQALTSAALSRNNYYLTDYLVQFGKTENLSYGHLLEITGGIERTDFYQRVYTGARVGAGNFFRRFGYLSGYIRTGIFIHGDSFEDGVFKANLGYFTPLLHSSGASYKFRTFLSVDYRMAINPRSNNNESYDANQFFKTDKVIRQDYFYGQEVLSGKVSPICYTPWYFYGFRVAIMVQLEAGVIANQYRSFLDSPLFSGVGLNLIIKNDNLIFPPVILSAYLYPSVQNSYNQLQFFMNSSLNFNYDDFNVSAPHVETLGN